ncbi:hypothetical protein FOC4_g10006311 [Fusarium odoratissimum]|uniref:Agglutinin-like protein 2 n=1 Tax=Fusarium oxysporum f. sp. cubense (strain race 4) TaxID=2502994 RepID=N1RB49_FUSC4|nr:hypothetical protein FOC4_g10006311 [Fusarium odoratissimum]
MLEPKELSGYVTVLQPLTGTLASLQLITISPTGTNRGSVIINVPTSALNGGSLQGLTLEPAQDGDYVTVIEPAGTAFSGTVPIRLTVPPSNGNPGTVIIQTPVPGTLRPLALEPLTPNTLGALGLAGQTITLQPAYATGYVTIIEPAEGSVTPTAPIRTTIPPTGTKPGTVLIQTPPGQGGDDDSGPRQTLTIPPEGGNPGTVLVLTPEDPNNPQTGNNGGGDNGAQATGGFSGGNQGDDDDDGASTTDEAGAEPSETDADAESETSGPDVTSDGSGSGAGPSTDEDGQTITDASGGNPTAGIPADNSLTTDAPDGALVTITVFRAGRGPARTTLYVPPQASNDPWTAVIETPVSETQSEAATARGDDDVLATTSAIGGNTNVTIFRAGSSPARRTLYVPPRFANEPGTIVIETPTGTELPATATAAETGLETAGVRPNITVYSSGTASSRITIYVPPTASDGDGYIIIETPVSEADTDATESAEDGSGPTAGTPAGIANVTVYSSGTASERRTIYIPPTASGEAGTIIIETPVSEPDEGETGGSDGGSQTTGLEPGVRPNVTVYSSGTASERITLYIPPTASGEAGTIIIQTPVSDEDSNTITGGPGDESGSTATSDDTTAVTIYTEATGSIGNTRYISPTASGELGTYIIETLASEADEETASDDSAEATGPEASITPVPTDEVSQGGSGNVTLYRAGEGSERSTIFIPPETTGDPWTIVIETPISQTELVETGTVPGFQTTVSAITGSANLTIFRAGVASTRTTLYVAPKTPGAPGTVIIETPVPRTQTGGLTANPEAQPTLGAGSNTTIFVPGTGPGRTTYYVPPSDPNDPGTVYVETPVSGAETEEPTDGPSATGDVTRTVYIPPTAAGEAGTLIIETPTGEAASTATGDGEEVISAATTVTIFSGGPASVTRTVYIPPTASGEAGTLIIETPMDGPEASASGPTAIITPEAPGNVTIYSGGPAFSTTTRFIPPTASGEPGTVVIETPTAGPQATATRTITIPATVSGELDTVLIETPTGGAPEVTITRGGPVSVATTITIPGAPGEPDTVLIESPTESGDAEVSESANGPGQVTSTRGGPVTAATTITIPGQSGQPDTVIIETPTVGAPGVTITRGGPVSVATTVTIPGAPGEPDTVLVETPIGSADGEPSVTGSDAGEVTSTRGGPVTAATTITIPGISGQPDTVIVETPTTASDVEVTSTRGGPVTAATTITIPGESGQPDTVIIETPTTSSDTETTETGGSPGEVTSTRGGPVTAATTITIPGESGGPDTVIVETPTRSNEPPATGGVQAVTSTRGGPVTAATTITIPGESGQPDTVIVETPRSSDEVEPSATEDSQDEITITRGGPVTAATTVTIPGVSGGPDTVFIETPTRSNEPSVTGGLQAITSTRGGPVTAATTITIPGESGQPDTVIVETPRSSDEIVPSATEGQDPVTITRGGPVTAATTVTIPGVSGGPDTVYIETPTRSSAGTAVVEEVTITRGGPVTAATTVTIPGVSGGPDTVFIETPTQSSDGPTETGVPEVTITRGGPVTAPITVTVPGVSGGPDTVYIEVPTESVGTGAVQEVTITRGGPVTAATTVTIPGGAGEPDTVYIETPTESVDGGSETPVTGAVQEVTITRGGPVTAATTVTIPGVSGGPDTVYIEIPTESATGGTEPPVTGAVQEVTITSGGPVTEAITITIPGASGEPDTVLVEVPIESAEQSSATGSVREVTITRGGPVTAAATLTIPGESGGPDTVLIETPTGSSGDDNEPSTTGSVREVTITRGGPVTAATTLTIPGESGGPDTVLVETPMSSSDEDGSTQGEVTITRGSPVTAATTLTIPGASVGRQNVTLYSGGPGTAVTTIYYPPASSEPDEPGTVVIQTPTAGPWEETPSASASEAATPIQNITRIVGGPASVTTTIYIPPTASGEPGVVIIETPTTGPDDEETSSASITATSSDEEATGIPNVTRYVGGPASITTTIYIPPASSGEPGTVLIQTPSAAPDDTTTSTALAESPSGVPNVTRYIDGPASVTTTYTIPPASSGEPGTVVIQTPSASPGESEVSASATEIPNVTRYIGGPASVTTTYTIPPASPGEPGTVVIQTPTASPEESATSSPSAEAPTEIPNVTRYVGGPASVTTTYTLPPASSGEPGTVIIQTPSASPAAETTSSREAVTSAESPSAIQNVTRFVGGPASVTTTIYIPPAASGEPGTVLIQTPSSAPEETSSSAAASTTRLPAVAQNTTIFGGGAGSTTRTIYIPPASEGEPGTVLIETPTDSPAASTTPTSDAPAGIPTTSTPIVAGTNITIFRAAPPTATAGRTLYDPPTAAGEPGTVIVETMVVSSTSGSAAPLTASSTSSAAPAPVTTSSTSVAAPVVTTSSSAAVPVVATSSSSTTSTSMMPQLAFGPTFDCDGFGYTVQSLLANTLTRVNLVTGQRTDIRTGIGPGGPINGIGFNRLDNYIYGFYQQPLVNALLCGLLGCKRSGLIRIAKDGRWEVLDLVIGTNAISMGDVDDQGRFWVSEGGGKWWCIDLRPTSNTFGQLLSSGTSATNLLSGVGDWAYVPGGGNYLYAVQASVIESGLLRTNIVRWSLTTQKWERFQSYPNLILTTLNLVWGAVMAAPDGTLFAQETVLGQTWKFTLGSTANPTAIPGGAILNLLGSDGARCAGTLVS